MMLTDFWGETSRLFARWASGQEKASQRAMAEALGMYMPSESDEIAVRFARSRQAQQGRGAEKPGGGVGGRRMGQPFPRPPTTPQPAASSEPAPSLKPASPQKRERPRKRNPEEEFRRKREILNRQYKVGCFLAFLGAAGSNDPNAGAKAVKQCESLAKARDYELWEAQVEYDEATGKSTAGPRPPIPYPDPPPQMAAPASPRDWLGRP